MNTKKLGRPSVYDNETMKPTPFRLGEIDLKRLADLCRISGHNKSEAIRAAIADAHAIAMKAAGKTLFDTVPPPSKKKGVRLQPNPKK